MSFEWTTCEQVTVQSNRYLPFPAKVRDVVGRDHPIKGPSVFWNYEQNAGFAVLSKESLQKPTYVDVARSKIYDVKAGEPGQGRLRPPTELDGVLRSKFTEGSQFYYLAYDSMEESDNPTTYLLSHDQFTSLLPTGMQDSIATGFETEDFQEALFELPAFLPQP